VLEENSLLEANMEKLNVGRMGMVLLTSSLVLAACTPPVPEVVNTQIRFVNAATKAGQSTDMDLYFDTTRKNTTPLGYRSVFPAANTYTTVPSGGLTYSWCFAGTIDCPKKDQAVETSKDKPKTVILLGTTETTDDTGDKPRPLELLTLDDDTPIPNDQKVKYRVVHAASLGLANKVDIHFTDPNAALLESPPSLDYKGIYDYREIPASTRRLRVTGQGTGVILVDSPSFDLMAGKVYTLLVLNPESGGVGVTLLTDR
jgi:hypothetical protein